MVENNEIWVFLSHSNKDYEKVRIVRNVLEEHGFRPLMFFLKCLDDDKNDDEVRHLIQREIDSRHRFILCDSPNARASDWVKEEVGYIQSKDRFYQTVDLKDVEHPEKLVESILRFKKRSTVLLSYSRYDSEVANALISRLRDTDFIISDLRTSLRTDDYSTVELKDSIKKSIVQGGYYIALISNYFIKSSWCMEELQYAIRCKGEKGFRKILPVQIEKMKSIPSNLTDLLSGIEIQDAYSNVIKEYADIYTNSHSLDPNSRIVFNIMDILYWEDMKNEFQISSENNHKKAWDHFQSGHRFYYDDRNHEGIEHAAAMQFMKAAYLGHVGAMRYLAECYDEGWGVVRNYAKAKELKQKASQNHAVYVCYDRRDFVPSFILHELDNLNISYITTSDLKEFRSSQCVENVIAQSRVILFIASKHSINNEKIKTQIDFAISRNIQVLIVKMDAVELPQSLNRTREKDIAMYSPYDRGAVQALLVKHNLSLW